MPKSTATTNESSLSRKDIELLSRLEGGQATLVSQINTMQVVNESQRQEHTKQIDAMRIDTIKQIEGMREDHTAQMNLLNISMTEIGLWRATTVTTERIKKWDDTSATVSNFQERYKGVVWLWGLLIALASIAGGWILSNILVPIFTSKPGG